MPVNDAKRRNNDRYNAKCDRIVLQPMKEEGAAIRKAAAMAGQSLQRYALDAIRARMTAEGFTDADVKTQEVQEDAGGK